MISEEGWEKKLNEFSACDTQSVLSLLGTSEHGLSSAEAEDRIGMYGRNVFSEKKKLGLFTKIISHLKSPLVFILIIAAGVSAYFGQVMDAIIIAVMVLLSVCLDFYLEHDAEKAAEKLKDRIKTKASVYRNGRLQEIIIENICVGDIISLEAGSLVPADARMLSAKDFFVNQSSLTGESFPCEKNAAKKENSSLSLTDMTNMVFLGTNVVSGSALAVVIKTGGHTEFGKIAKSLVAKEQDTEFDKGMKSFGYLILKLTLFLVLFIFLFNSLMRHNVLESFIFAIAVAVGLTPELLPMIMSVSMAKGSLRMAEKGVIVKKLSSIPNFGSMDVLCTDKTGTLTEDKIRLVKYMDMFGKPSEKVFEYAYVNSFHHTGIKNVLDDAVLEYKHEKISSYKKIDEMPFDFVRRKMSVIVSKDKKAFLITKGAPEEVLSSSKYYENNGKKRLLTPKIIKRINEEYHSLSNEGYRVLAVAIKQVKSSQKAFSKNDEQELQIIGLIAFLDPPKYHVSSVIKELHRAGVDIKIITGDNELITKKICDEIGLEVKGILLGKEINEMTEDALRVRVEKTTIFARFSPDQKNAVIRALKENGHVVGYMGDGINDAPSLKNADIGISVDGAVDVAKESADMILTHKSLSVLQEGIFEGRKTFSNTTKYIMLGLSSNFGNMFSIAIAVLFLPFLPMLPVQILLNNFIYDFSQITIPSDNVDREAIEKPRRWNMKFIKNFMMHLGPISSLFDIITFVIFFFLLKLPAAQFQTGWFIESMATQTLVVFIIRTKKVPFLQSLPSKKLFFSSIICVALACIIPFTPVGAFFKFEPVSAQVMWIIAGLVVFYLLMAEIAKRIFYRRHDL